MNREKLEQLLAQSSLPWWEWDVRKNTVMFNELKVTALGYKMADFEGKGYEAFTNLLHPDDLEKTMDAMLAVLNRKTKLYQTDYRILTADKTYKWYMDRGFVLEADAEGKPLKIRGIVIDLGYVGVQKESALALLDILYKSAEDFEKTGRSQLTVCSNCRKAKQNVRKWVEISDEIMKLIGEEITHGICMDCIQVLYPELAKKYVEEFKKICD